MKLLFILIVMSLPADADYVQAAEVMRAAAKSVGCEYVVMERITHEGRDTVELLLRCREVSPDG